MDDDEIETVDAVEEQVEEETQDTNVEGKEKPEDEESVEQPTDEADEVTVTIEGQEAQPQEDEREAAPWVRELRKKHQETTRQNRELQAKITQLETAAKGTPSAAKPLGEKPTLAGCDYDEARFEQDLSAWQERKRAAEEETNKAEAAAKAAKDAWDARLAGYNKAKAALKVKGFEEAEAAFMDAMSPMQQGIVVNGFDRAELVVFATGSNAKLLKELSDIKDPVKFTIAVSRLEQKLSVTPRKTAPLPEGTVRGSAPASGAVDSTLERLRAEADKTGDRSKVIAYQRQKAQKRAA